jgi:hypothetical protein
MTNPFLAANPVFALSNRVTKWISGELLFHLAVMAGAMLLVWLGVTFVERFRFRFRLRFGVPAPQGLFRELCRAHELTRSDRQLLGLVCQDVTPDQCCRVFIDSRVIDAYSRAHPALAEECRRLSQRLFGGFRS